MDVVHENFATICFRPIIALINQQARVGMPTARRARPRIPGMRPLVARPMHMVSYRLNIVIDVGVEMRSRLALVARSLNHVEQVRNDARLDEALTVLVEINSPWIARS